ncbi:iron-containing alcohol dehydrogenase [Cohaesibacter sp. CAU 1516]|uniref:iron-containing alcohol dehydrogenase n=1 Tax=Cohaesibacter sp. CAU 1516 TaxID=2576038 RepID=UPI0010FDAD0C|nr:iron-containing alcohol dehydrogenase [Cohaesibacter sp. CAU 1516]TLP48200.1 iron-containing alcohol dehydrogenase [Cohaesibacter sp. CAU 1516]
MSAFTFRTTPCIRAEAGVSAKLGPEIAAQFGRSILIVTDKGLVAAGLLAPFIASLEKAGVKVAVFDEVVADPPACVVEAAKAHALDHQVEAIIGFGGGSSLDVAKLVALLVGGGEALEDLYGVDQAKGNRLPLILIPTTAGTGSEVTPISIITVGEGEKKGVVTQQLIPDWAVLDAELTLGLPAEVTAATGVDAMVHAIEAYSSKSLNNNPISKGLAKGALELLGANIVAAVRDGSNLQVRSNMLLGSLIAGQAFANSPVAAVHALAYPIGGLYHVPHGLSNALVLPHVMAFNAAVCDEAYGKLAPLVFPDLRLVAPDRRTAQFVARMADLCSELGLKTQLRQVGIERSDLPHLASEAMKQTRLLVNNPRPVDEVAALAIYKAAW